MVSADKSNSWKIMQKAEWFYGVFVSFRLESMMKKLNHKKSVACRIEAWSEHYK